MIDHGKRNVLGVNIDAVDYEAAVSRFIEAAKSNKRYTTTALAVHGVMTGAWDNEHRHRLNQLDMLFRTGCPFGGQLTISIPINSTPDRVYGPNLMLFILKEAAAVACPLLLWDIQGDIGATAIEIAR